jgi:hypothetical protein
LSGEPAEKKAVMNHRTPKGKAKESGDESPHAKN